jgi:anti-sigma factor RsiW
MPCDISDHKLTAFFDGELPRADQAGVAAHIAACGDCARNLQAMQDLRKALRRAAPSVPAGLSSRIEMALEEEKGGEPQVIPAPIPMPTRWRWPATNYGALAASYIIVAALAGVGGMSWMSNTVAMDAITHDVVAAHARAMMQDVPYQVVSSDQHTVKPWFAGRTEFSPQVKDFAAQGYSLAGGRLDYVGGERVAALVYRHDKHVVDLFVWPSSRPDSAPQFETKDGFHIASWVSGGMEARAVSDMGADEMKTFAGLASQP